MTQADVLIPGTGFALPRVLDGAAMSARAWNTVDRERALLGATYRVARTTAWESIPVAHIPDGDWYMPWETGSGAGGVVDWSPGADPIVTIRETATYLLFFQMRFAAVGPYGLNGTNVGYRKCRIMLNGTAPPQHTIAGSAILPGTTAGNGVTCQAIAIHTLRRGDDIYSGFRHSSTPPLTMANTDFGGTYLSITRLGPGASS